MENTDARFSRLSLNYEDDNGHVVFSRFGLTPKQGRSQLDVLLDELPAVLPTAAEILTLTCYQTENGIFNHDQPHHDRPLALVAMHDAENVVEGGPLFTHIRRYRNYRIGELFGLSLTEFLELPLHVVEFLYDIAAMESVSTERTTRQLQQQMAHDLKGG